MKIFKPTMLAALLTLGTSVQAGPIEDAQQAALLLDEAKAQLVAARDKTDRVDALTQTLVALEQGMAAVRKGLRNAARRETALRQQLKSRQSDIAETLLTLQTIERAQEPAMLLHPMGPTGTARSAMILSELAPALQSQIAELDADLKEIEDLSAVQQQSRDVLQSAVSEVQSARADLSQSISSRTELPKRFVEDTTKTALLLATSDTLDAFAGQLREIAQEDQGALLADAEALPNGLTPPVVGRVLRKFNEVDAAGIKRPGIILVTEPGAIVTAPTAATVRYQGPLLEYGQVIILEPAAGVMFVFAGLGQIFAETGEVVNEGAPLGLMSEAIGGSRLAQDTLYIEVRQNQTPVDPLTWFAAQ